MVFRVKPDLCLPLDVLLVLRPNSIQFTSCCIPLCETSVCVQYFSEYTCVCVVVVVCLCIHQITFADVN